MACRSAQHLLRRTSLKFHEAYGQSQWKELKVDMILTLGFVQSSLRPSFERVERQRRHV